MRVEEVCDKRNSLNEMDTNQIRNMKKISKSITKAINFSMAGVEQLLSTYDDFHAIEPALESVERSSQQLTNVIAYIERERHT